MTDISFEKLAARNEPMPEGLNSAQQMYYQGLCFLHARYRAGDITAEEGKQIKAQMVRSYETAAFELNLWENERVRWENLAGAAAEFRKNPCTDTAWELHRVLYGFRQDKTSS